jgi:hypothetical protein
MARCTLFLALLGTTAYGADVYRSKGADGTVSYSDRPQGENSEYVLVATPRTGAAAAAQRPARGAAGANAAAATAPPQAPATPTAAAGPTAAQLREQRAKNCATARETQQRFTVSRRLFRTNAAGEREYLSDQQIDEARAKAAADVEDWCG